jgi:hypothetical protein
MKTQDAVAVDAQPESASLWFKDIRSDKTYILSLSQCETGWTVTASYGRRGLTQVTENKVERVEYVVAKRLYDKVLHEKLAKGYRSVEDMAAAHERRFERAPVGPAPTRARQPISRDVIFSPELLTRIDAKEAALYARNPRYGFQQKRDGVRLAVCLQDGDLFGYNKLGQRVLLDVHLFKVLTAFVKENNLNALLIDGEWEASGLWAWDLLQFGGVDFRERPYRERQAMLAKLFSNPNELVHVVPIVWTTEGKLALWNNLQENRAEGFAVKDGDVPWCGGRAGQHKKMKFETTSSFIVGPKPAKRADDGHRSIALYVIDKGKQRFVATCKVADRYNVPPENAVVDCRYLYAHEGGGIVQPCYFGVVRNDVRPSECVAEQLKYKQDQDEEEAA